MQVLPCPLALIVNELRDVANRLTKTDARV